MKIRRYYLPAFTLLLLALSFVTLMTGVEAKTATATWSCGSVLDPKSMSRGLAGADQPADAQVMFIAGEAACSSRRDQALAHALRYLLPGLGLGLAMALTGPKPESTAASHAEETFVG